MKNNTESKPVVGIIMGSQSDWATMGETASLLKQLDIPFETKIVSAHRTPKLLNSYAEEAEDRGLQVIIAGAGGAAHLPGMTAATTHLPVLGVPVQSKALNGQEVVEVEVRDRILISPQSQLNFQEDWQEELLKMVWVIVDLNLLRMQKED